MDTKPPECFGTDPRARGLRVELSSQRSFVLAHEHFLYSEFNAGDGADVLKLVFVSHEVVLTGHLLRRIETGIQTRELAWVAARPDRYRAPGNERAFIANVKIRALSEDHSSPAPNDHESRQTAQGN